MILIDEGDICTLCLNDDSAPDAEPCVRCNEFNLQFEWKLFPIHYDEENKVCLERKPLKE